MGGQSIIKGQEKRVKRSWLAYMRAAVQIRRLMAPIHVAGIEETLDVLINEKKSIARYGDGEMYIMRGGDTDFQKYNKILADRLAEILCADNKACLIGLPPAIASFKGYKESPKGFWINNMYMNRHLWERRLDGRNYYSANITRPYIDYQDHNKCGAVFDRIKELWKSRSVLIIEGEGTRFGVGNDLLDGAQEVRRIICPSKNSFSFYGEIMETVRRYAENDLLLIALGPTATVLAYDLAKEGFQAIDIGHCDLEYEWYLKGAKQKEIVVGKYTNEVRGGNRVPQCNDTTYLSEIVARIN